MGLEGVAAVQARIAGIRTRLDALSGTPAQTFASEFDRLLDAAESGSSSAGAASTGTNDLSAQRAALFGLPSGGGGTSTESTGPTGEARGSDNLTPQARYLRQLISKRFGVSEIGGYRPSDPIPDSDHPKGKAVDVMLTPMGTASTSKGDAIAAWLQRNAGPLHVKYVIWQQRIWSVERSSEGWRPMENRGSATANHRDHVHVSLY